MHSHIQYAVVLLYISEECIPGSRPRQHSWDRSVPFGNNEVSASRSNQPNKKKLSFLMTLICNWSPLYVARPPTSKAFNLSVIPIDHPPLLALVVVGARHFCLLPTVSNSLLRSLSNSLHNVSECVCENAHC